MNLPNISRNWQFIKNSQTRKLGEKSCTLRGDLYDKFDVTTVTYLRSSYISTMELLCENSCLSLAVNISSKEASS